RGRGCQLRWLHQAPVARGEDASKGTEREGDWEVPRTDDADDPERLVKYTPDCARHRQRQAQSAAPWFHPVPHTPACQLERVDRRQDVQKARDLHGPLAEVLTQGLAQLLL